MSQITFEKDTVVIYADVKFVFERWNSTRKKKLKPDKGITIELLEKDTTHTIYGYLYKAE